MCKIEYLNLSKKIEYLKSSYTIWNKMYSKKIIHYIIPSMIYMKHNLIRDYILYKKMNWVIAKKAEKV